MDFDTLLLKINLLQKPNVIITDKVTKKTHKKEVIAEE